MMAEYKSLESLTNQVHYGWFTLKQYTCMPASHIW